MRKMMHHPEDAPAGQLPVGLTPKQRACLDAIEAHFAQTRTMPSIENLRIMLGSGSKTAVLRLLRQLEDRGRIARIPRRVRAIRLLESASCPHCGGRSPQQEGTA
jgi:SOS-response transcriptional repressor LexA